MAKTPTVICDLDDVISNFLGTLCRLHNRLYGTVISEYDIHSWDFKDVNIKDAHGNIFNGKDLKRTMEEYETEIYAAMEPYSDSKYALDIIQQIGYKIIILTARPSQFEKQTRFNLIMRDLPFDQLILDWDKAKVIKELSKTHDVKLMVDDNVNTIRNVYDNCKVNTVCLMERRHNVNEKVDDDIKRVGSLIDCVRFLKKVIKKSK